MAGFKWDKAKKQKQAGLEHRQEKHENFGKYLDAKELSKELREQKNEPYVHKCNLTPYDLEFLEKTKNHKEEKRKRSEEERKNNKTLRRKRNRR